jgi:hypothetical protein
VTERYSQQQNFMIFCRVESAIALVNLTEAEAFLESVMIFSEETI